MKEQKLYTWIDAKHGPIECKRYLCRVKHVDGTIDEMLMENFNGFWVYEYDEDDEVIEYLGEFVMHMKSGTE